MQIALIFLIGLGTSFLTNISGGGGALIQLPALLAIGVSPLDAIGTGKIGAIGLIAGSNLSKQHKTVIRRDHVKPLIIAVLISSLIGPYVALNLDESTVKIISSIFVIVGALTALLTWRSAQAARLVSTTMRRLGYVAYTISTTLLAGFGSGIGIVNTYILIGLVGMSPIEAIGTRRYIGLFGLPLQTLPFILTGHFNIKFGLALLVGSSIGSFFGMSVAIKKGNEFVKKAMALASVVLVASLFL